MKKLLLAVATMATIFATSCKKENVNEPVNPEDIPANTFYCTIDNASTIQNMPRMGDGMGTLATINDQHSVCWEMTDHISVNSNDFRFSKPVEGDGAFFVGEMPENAPYHAFYPNDIQKPNAQGLLNYCTLKKEIVYDPAHPAANLPMYAYNNDQTNPTLTFKNVCAVLELNIPDVEGCKTIKISANEALAGFYGIDYTTNSNQPFAYLGNTAEKEITITKVSNGEFTNGEKVYVAIPQRMNYNNSHTDILTYTDFQIKLLNSENEQLNETKKKEIKVKANTMYPVTITKIETGGGGQTTDGIFMNGEFSIGPNQNDKVRFTNGNLYYTGSAYGIESTQLGGTYPDASTSHICQFFYCTTIENAAAETYANTFTQTSLFCAETSPITIGSDEGLFALTRRQWEYLLGIQAPIRANADNLRKLAMVNGKGCLLIAPDNYQGSINDEYSSIASVTNAGLVCLPPTGVRNFYESYEKSYHNGGYGAYFAADITYRPSVLQIRMYNDGGLNEDFTFSSDLNPEEEEEEDYWNLNWTASIRLVQRISNPSSIKGKNVLHF